MMFNNGFVNLYGLGLIVEMWCGVCIVYYVGGVMGGNCQMLVVFDYVIQIVVIINCSDVVLLELVEKILGVLLEE